MAAKNLSLNIPADFAGGRDGKIQPVVQPAKEKT